MYKHFQRLERGGMISVGAAFRFYIGELTIPHLYAQILGFQWIWRLTQDWSSSAYSRKTKFQSLADRFIFLRYLPYELYHARKSRRLNPLI